MPLNRIYFYGVGLSWIEEVNKICWRMFTYLAFACLPSCGAFFPTWYIFGAWTPSRKKLGNNSLLKTKCCLEAGLEPMTSRIPIWRSNPIEIQRDSVHMWRPFCNRLDQQCRNRCVRYIFIIYSPSCNFTIFHLSQIWWRKLNKIRHYLRDVFFFWPDQHKISWFPWERKKR